MMLKQHLDMIGRNEPIQRKAKFWQSYVRALKGTDDMRAPEIHHYHPPPRSIYRPYVSEYPSWPSFKSMYDDPVNPHERINVPGYRYLPISRDTYGISPRNIQPHHYPPHYDRVYPRVGIHDAPFKGLKHWDDHLDRMAQLNALFAQRPSFYRPRTPIRPYYLPRSWAPLPALPSEKSSVFNHLGQPIYTRGGYTRKPLTELLEPSWLTPKSRITLDDPWWWEYPELRPFTSPYTTLPRTPFYLRNSFLSPIKRTYLWGYHPIRPFYNLRNYLWLYHPIRPFNNLRDDLWIYRHTRPITTTTTTYRYYLPFYTNRKYYY